MFGNPVTATNWQRTLAVIGSLILVVTALYFAQEVLIPLVVAILLTFVLSPVVLMLQRRGLGRVPSVLLVVLLAFCLIGGIGVAVVSQVQSLAAELPKHKQDIINKIQRIRQANQGSWIEQISNTANDILKHIQGNGTPESGAAPNQPVPVKMESSFPLVETVVRPAATVLIGAGLVIILVIFMLISREDLRNRMIRLIGSGSLTSMTKAFDDALRRISRYLLTQLMVNTGFGVALGCGLAIIGLPYAFLWGFVAALLRYIPYLGTWIAMLLPIAYSVAVSPGWTQPLLVFGLFLGLELITSQAIEPIFFGHSVGVSAVALLVAAAFWGWLWGPIGLVLSTPITACLVVLGNHVPMLEFFSVLLGDEPVLETYVTYYQRMLARDPDEATELVEDYLQHHPAEEVYDQVFLPALVMAKRNQDRGELSTEDVDYMTQVTHEVMDDLLAARVEVGERPPDTVVQAESEPVLVYGCPARDALDELGLLMLQQTLEPSRCRFKILSHEKFTGELLAKVAEKHPALVCVGAIPSKGLAHTRYVCKRLRSQFPDLKILVGCWGTGDANPERTRSRLQAAGADQVSFSLAETRAQLIPLVQVESHRQEAALSSA